MSCYGDGNGEFELNFHVITVARLSIDLLLDENSDKVEGKGLFCCYFVLLALSIKGPNMTHWFVAWLG